MVELAEDDFLPIAQFPLKWRWTDITWNLLSETDLAQIRPLCEAKANELFENTRVWVNGDALENNLFEEISQFSDRDTIDSTTAQNWLREHKVNSTEQVVVSWDKRLAAFTNWDIFCNYWDDFCYPISHNVLIYPLSEQWALFYHHEEIFFFGTKKT